MHFVVNFNYYLCIIYTNLELEYTSNTNTACCLKNGERHRICARDGVSTPECESACTADAGCKGYAKHIDIAHQQCQLASISSPCPDGFFLKQLASPTGIGELDSQTDCHKGSFEGCFIKKGTYAQFCLMFSLYKRNACINSILSFIQYSTYLI